MIVHPESHVDHVSAEVLALIKERYADRSGFFVDTFELPLGLSVECGLHGPIMRDAPIPHWECWHDFRPGRGIRSRLCARRPRMVRTLTVVAGPYKGEPCVLFTAYGGPVAPREVEDEMIETEAEREKSREFWAQHALSGGDQ